MAIELLCAGNGERMRYRDIEKDLADLRLHPKANMQDSEILYYQLRVWHCIAASLERIADLVSYRKPER